MGKGGDGDASVLGYGMPRIRRLLSVTALCAGLLAAAPTTPTALAGDRTMELTPDWEYVADSVMGGVSRGALRAETVDGRDAARLTGTVSLENNGGFIQMAFAAAADMSAWTGIELEVFGNGEAYDLRLRTDQLTRPWQSYRATFTAPPAWTTVRIPFGDLVAHRTEAAFDPRRVRRIGVLAIGRAFAADIAVAGVRLYR